MSNLHVWYTDPWGKLLPWSFRDEREGEELAMFICSDDTKEARIPEGTKEFTSLPSLPELRILHLPSTLERNQSKWRFGYSADRRTGSSI